MLASTAAPLRVPAVIIMLVVLERGDHGKLAHSAEARQDHGAFQGVTFHNVPLGVGERVRLIDDFQRYLHLADIMEHPGDPQGGDLGFFQRKECPQGDGQDGHVHRMGKGVFIMELDAREAHEGIAVLQDAVHHGMNKRLHAAGVDPPPGVRRTDDVPHRLYPVQVRLRSLLLRFILLVVLPCADGQHLMDENVDDPRLDHQGRRAALCLKRAGVTPHQRSEGHELVPLQPRPEGDPSHALPRDILQQERKTFLDRHGEGLEKKLSGDDMEGRFIALRQQLLERDEKLLCRAEEKGCAGG